MEKHPLQLKTPELQKSEEVQNSVAKYERLNDEKLPNDPTDRIEAHMDRLEKIFLNPDERVRQRNLEMLREGIYDAYIIKPEEVPESYFELQQRVARERGIDAENITPDIKERMINVLIEDQKHSLDQWIDYLTSDDAVYPTWFKYFVFQNITKLSQFDKSLGKFKKRTTDTTAPYPDVFREPLAQICDVYEKVAKDNNLLKTDPKIQEEFSKSFPKLYAEKITESLSAKLESNESIRGKWVKYEQGNQQDAEKLYKSLQGKGTGWCTAGDSTARTQIESGDFYVFYSDDKDGNPVQPRLAIRMGGTDKIGEVRGINEHQNVEPIMSPVLEEKLKDFGPEAEKYKKKSADMKQLTEIDKKIKENPQAQLSKEELRFLYELDAPIEGFGYSKDPRIEEILVGRDVKKDLPIIFDCQPEQIATLSTGVNENTVTYLGPWNPTIYEKIRQYPNIKYIYERFPNKKIFLRTIETNTEIQLADRVEKILTTGGHRIFDSAKDILSKVEFSKESKEYNLVSFSVGQLGFLQGATTEQIYNRAKELGLETCPAEVGPLLRSQYTDQPKGEYLWIAMKSILNAIGIPHVFGVHRYPDGSWLVAYRDEPGGRFNPVDRFVFCRK